MNKSKRIPITAAKRIAEEYGKDQVIIVTWDKATGTTWVTTYGKTVEECAQAADGGNRVKRALGWPESLCNAKPARTKTACKHCVKGLIRSTMNPEETFACSFCNLDGKRTGK